MDESFTPTISGNSSVLEAKYFPPIELSANKNYALGLVELLTSNSTPNVDRGKNKFYIGDHVMTILPGSYEIGDIEKYIQLSLANKNYSVVYNSDEMENRVQKNQEIKDAVISMKPNNNTLRSEIKSTHVPHFESKDAIGQLSGFEPRLLSVNKLHTSDLPVAILNVNALRVDYDITTSAYINNRY